MDDQFMYRLRSTPDSRFADRLRQCLEQEARTEREGRGKQRRWIMAAAFVLALALFALPSVRASAQSFLNLFRVVNFAAVPVNVERLNQLAQNGMDLPSLIGQQVEVLENPGPPRIFSTLDELAGALGTRPKVPAVVPPYLVLVRIEMAGQRSLRVTADAQKLQSVLDALGITDLRAPDRLAREGRPCF
jgi:hypothetical protein